MGLLSYGGIVGQVDRLKAKAPTLKALSLFT